MTDKNIEVPAVEFLLLMLKLSEFIQGLPDQMPDGNAERLNAVAAHIESMAKKMGIAE